MRRLGGLAPAVILRLNFSLDINGRIWRDFPRPAGPLNHTHTGRPFFGLPDLRFLLATSAAVSIVLLKRMGHGA